MPIDNEPLETALTEPAKAGQDGRLAEQHKLSDMLEVQRAMQSDQAASGVLERDGKRFSTGGIRTSTLYSMD